MLHCVKGDKKRVYSISVLWEEITFGQTMCTWYCLVPFLWHEEEEGD